MWLSMQGYKMLISNRLRIEQNKVCRIYRTLPGKGKINVSTGQEVSPSDIIGTSQVSSGFRIINLSQLLSIQPKDIEKYLKKQIGQRIYKGELLAYKGGSFFAGKKIVTAPTDSTLDFINTKTGDVRMSIFPKKLSLPAGVFGIVDGIDHEKSRVFIKTLVSRIYGVLGTGRLREGILHVIGKREEMVSANMITPDMSDAILLGGSLINKEAISQAISEGASGIITGGLNAQDYKSIAGGKIIFPPKLETDIGITIVATEGFGSIPPGWDVYEMLAKYNGKFVTIDGNLQVLNLPSFESTSLEIVRRIKIPKPKEELLEDGKEVGVLELQVGMKVRVVGTSYTGEQGKVVAIDKLDSLLPSNLRAIIVTLETKRRKLQVPLQNIEALQSLF